MVDRQARQRASAAKSFATKVASTRKLWLPARIRQREVMASPPTVTTSTSHTITSPRGYLAVNSDSAHTTTRLNPLFRYRRCCAPAISGTTYPNYMFVKSVGVNYGSSIGSNPVTNMFGVSVLCDGSEIEFFVKGTGANFWFKVDGQYVSLTPTTPANDGGLDYIYLNFGSAAMREIELIGNSATNFGGVYTSQTATVAVAHPRGPRTLFVGDSFIEGTGTTTNGIANIPQVFADAMGWDDVRPSAVGGTGLIANTSGTRLTYLQRLATDVIAYSPDLVILWGSINDAGASYSSIQTAAQSAISQIKAALPNCQVVLTSNAANKGGGFFASAAYLSSDGLRDIAAANGVPFVNMLEQPSFETFDTSTTTLASTAAINATSISVNAPVAQGATYRFADATHVYVKSISGTGPYTATIDNLPTGQTSGAVITPCGNSLWSGSGRVGTTTGFGNCDVVVSSDNTHPTDAGHQMIGTALAFGLMNVL